MARRSCRSSALGEGRTPEPMRRVPSRPAGLDGAAAELRVCGRRAGAGASIPARHGLPAPPRTQPAMPCDPRGDARPVISARISPSSAPGRTGSRRRRRRSANGSSGNGRRAQGKRAGGAPEGHGAPQALDAPGTRGPVAGSARLQRAPAILTCSRIPGLLRPGPEPSRRSGISTRRRNAGCGT